MWPVIIATFFLMGGVKDWTQSPVCVGKYSNTELYTQLIRASPNANQRKHFFFYSRWRLTAGIE